MQILHLLKRLALGLIIGIVVTIATLPMIGYLVEKPPIRYLNSPFPTIDPVPADQPISTTVERCNDTPGQLVTTVPRQLVNDDTGRIMSLVPGGGLVPTGCTTITGGIGLPQGVVPGRYHVEQMVLVEGRWRTFQIPVRTQTFTVVESE